jgi:rhodanese-related sulfurtransferase
VPGKSYVVVDVRDDDRAGGHIKGSINVPSNGFLMAVDELVRDTLKKEVETVVFHCALSQVRYVYSAACYEHTDIKFVLWVSSEEVQKQRE